jgi:mono/diheme cytochrome c family protein
LNQQTPPQDSRFDPKDVQSFLILLGATILFVLFFLVLIPTATRWGLEPHTVDQPAVLDPGWLDPAEAPTEAGRDIPPVDPAEVMSPTPLMMERGKTLFAQNCATCHGEKGAGDGPAAAATNPKPRNFAIQAGWKNGSTLTGIYKTLGAGIPGSSMAAFDTLTPKDRMSLVHIVRSVGSFDHGKDDPKALLAMADQFRSSGGRIPNRIPVSEAEKTLVAEAAPAPALSLPGAGDSDPSATLARRVIWDPVRAARVLHAVPGWETDADILSRPVVAGAPANGFTAGVGALAPSEWKDLQIYLARSVSRRN